MKTFKQFLADKSISDEDWKAKTAEEMAALHKEYNEAVQKSIADAIANKTDEKAVKSLIDNAIKGIEGFATSEQMKNLEDILKKQGETLTNLKGGSNGGNSFSAQIRKFFEDNQEKIREIKSAGHGMLELELKDPELITTGNATIVGDVPNIAGIQQAGASNVNLRGTFVEDLVNTIQTSLAAYPYTETLPKDGDFEFVAEGEVKPQIDFEIETQYAKPFKIAAYVKLTDEAVEDIDGLEDIARNYLRKKHDLKKQKAILIGDGSAGAPLGAAEIGRTFNAGAMAGTVTNPNFMDVVNAGITDIYMTPNYEDELEYRSSLVLVSPLDFFIHMVSAKTSEGTPLYPTAGLFNQVNIGGVTIRPTSDIDPGKILIADMDKYNVTNYKPYTVKVGWVNDDFIRNQFVILGESRFHAFVKRLDEAAFLYDDIATIQDAIGVVTPETPEV